MGDIGLDHLGLAGFDKAGCVGVFEHEFHRPFGYTEKSPGIGCDPMSVEKTGRDGVDVELRRGADEGRFRG